MTTKKKHKSHLLEKIQLLILLENQPDYKIAAMCGVAPSTILNIRHGNHMPSVVMAEHIYETLSGFSLGDFDL
jgi:transcriptional regulator with XRE-family HTH domain